MGFLAQYNGRSYSLRKYNCWDHVVSIRKDVGIDTPLHSIKAGHNIKESCFIARDTTTLNQFDDPENFDIVVVEVASTGLHCGLFYDGFVSHCAEYYSGSVTDSIHEFTRFYGKPTFWR